MARLLTSDVRQLESDSQRCEEARVVMRHLLAALPEPLRAALLLQVTQGLSIADIGYVLDCSEAQAAVLLHQARTAIFRQVEQSRGGANGN